MSKVIDFDVNETPLDVAALDPLFDRLFGDASVRREWFGQMLQSAFVATITDSYRDFGVLCMSALEMVAVQHGVTVTEDDRATLGAGVRSLPPHPEVREAMEHLRDAGFRLATLTNSILTVSEAQMANAGLDDLLERLAAYRAGGVDLPIMYPPIGVGAARGDPDVRAVVARGGPLARPGALPSALTSTDSGLVNGLRSVPPSSCWWSGHLFRATSWAPPPREKCASSPR